MCELQRILPIIYTSFACIPQDVGNVIRFFFLSNYELVCHSYRRFELQCMSIYWAAATQKSNPLQHGQLVERKIEP